MLSTRARPPIHVRLLASRQLMWALLVVHGVAALSVALVSLPLSIEILLCIIIASSLVDGILRQSWRVHPLAVTAISVNQQNQWRLHQRNARCREVEIIGGSLVVPGLIVLNSRRCAESARRSYGCLSALFDRYYSTTIFADAACEEELRRLRVRLRTTRDSSQECLAGNFPRH
ncbi:MAG TPA: hypothetical protein EYN26_03080 [Chromatiales bacterium]|nr:hypothetical protein [Chromatiaceae bacterium]HIB83213.1 hypothetical protein [Chromatiaceae bacterium]HIO13798.1 hypothetical protein [Chromatiales bacterium]HIO54112.1 hypothetical protein [Chromatiales bacterium]